MPKVCSYGTQLTAAMQWDTFVSSAWPQHTCLGETQELKHWLQQEKEDC